jgi:enoyl-CoA hydratase
MPSSNVVWDIDGPLATLTFARPEAKNAMTWDMYIIRGSDGAFSAGTDIAQFAGLTTGEAGIAYERRIGAVIDRLERVTTVTVASIAGPAVGGGCAIALACDLRLCADTARFGVPVARTLGNCLSVENLARLVDLIGVGRATDMMLTGRLISADQALEWGLATRVAPVGELEADTQALARDLATRATSTITATKQMLRRLRAVRRPAEGACDDLVAACYGSADFREGVAAFAARRPPSFG